MPPCEREDKHTQEAGERNLGDELLLAAVLRLTVWFRIISGRRKESRLSDTALGLFFPPLRSTKKQQKPLKMSKF